MKRAVAAFMLAPMLTGCSAIFLTEAPPYDESLKQIQETGVIHCTRLPILPAVDAGIGTGAGLLTWLFVGLSEGEDEQNDAVAAGLGLGLLAVFAASAVYGFSESSVCRDQYEAFEQERLEWRKTHGR